MCNTSSGHLGRLGSCARLERTRGRIVAAARSQCGALRTANVVVLAGRRADQGGSDYAYFIRPVLRVGEGKISASGSVHFANCLSCPLKYTCRPRISGS